MSKSSAMKELFEGARGIAPELSNVLLEGETGTGKRILAKALHALSARRRGPFIVVNLEELSSTLLPSELFGHARGAFTGAEAEKLGLAQAADTGILFLDEINKADLPAQRKILRLVEERVIRRVGETIDRKVDIAIIAASTADLWGEVKAGRFLGDLYFRLKVGFLRIPPLRERPEDIPPLLGSFIGEYARKFGRAVPRISPRTWELLLAHAWPGNVRELENTVPTIFALAGGGEINPGRLQSYLTPNSFPAPLEEKKFVPPLPQGERVPDFDPRREATCETLRRFRGKKAPAARALGISRQTLYWRIHHWGLFEGR